MKYPNFLQKYNTIGVCAPSAGVGDKLDDYNKSLDILKKQGYKIVETASVRNNNQRSTTSKKRGEEFNSLVSNNKIDSIIFAAGGDYMLEMLPYANFELVKNNPKWMMGYSDPTNILFVVTTMLDIATLYGYNACSYEQDNTLAQRINLEYLKGNLKVQHNYHKYRDHFHGHQKYDLPVKWVANKDDIDIKGRCIGGCFDVIEKLIGSKFDHVNKFINRYKDDGIVWYFDVFAMSSYNFYLSLLQMKNAGYFKYCKGVLIGRVAFSNIENKKLDYIKAAKKALGNIPTICEMDIGHVEPRMTMINGAIINVKYKENKGSISFKLR